MRTWTILLIASFCAVPATARQAIKTECRDLNGSNQLVAPDEVVVPAGSGYKVCRTTQTKPASEVTPTAPLPAGTVGIPTVATPAPTQSTRPTDIPVQDFGDFTSENVASACSTHPDSKVRSIQTGTTLSCSDWLAIRARALNAARPVASTVQPEAQPTKHGAAKRVTFAVAGHNGIEYYVPGWVQHWVKKNAKKYPGMVFTEERAVANESYLIVLSDSPSALSGFEPVTRTTTSTSTSPVSGSGTVTDNYGGMWDYSYDGTATTTTTTQTTHNEAYTIQSNTLYATTFDSQGRTVSKHWHTYSTKSGGNASNSLGYNLGNALASINARGRLLNGAAKDIEKSK